MKVQCDISYEELKKAVEKIEKKKGICKHLPNARFVMCDWENDLRFDTLVCSPKLGGNQTGIAAERCENCLKSD